jgi:2-dehydropantoate 2-reductase
MRILVVGAGAIGGYFGGRLLQAGRDVTFLVRARRAAELAQAGLVIKSPAGDATLPSPPTVLAEDLRDPFDLILLSCKAYDLDGAIDSFAPAVGQQTSVLPLLNGMRHLDILDQRLGPQHVLGGQCYIAATLDESHAIVHLSANHELTFGERHGILSDRVRRIAEEMAAASFVSRASTAIMREMWEKWVFLASLAGSTCLMRASIGDIVQSSAGRDFVLGLFDECGTIATVNDYPPRSPFIEQSRLALTAQGSSLTASMLRDIERGSRIEAEHIIGDLIRRAAEMRPGPALLPIVYAHLKAYEARHKLTG